MKSEYFVKENGIPRQNFSPQIFIDRHKEKEHFYRILVLSISNFICFLAKTWKSFIFILSGLQAGWKICGFAQFVHHNFVDVTFFDLELLWHAADISIEI